MNQSQWPDPQMWDPEATEVLPPATAASYPPRGDQPPLEATRTLPRIEEPEPVRRPAPRRRASPSGPPRAVLVAVAIVVCAAVGLGIGAVLGGSGEEPGPPVARAASPSAAQGSPSPTASPEASPEATPSVSFSPEAPPVPAGLFVLLDERTGRAVDVQAGSLDDGAAVIVWDVHGQPNQQWTLTDLGGGQVQIKAVHSGKCLQATEPFGPGAAVVQQTCVGTDGQRWTVTADAGLHTFGLPAAGLVLTVDGEEAGAPLRLQVPDPAAPRRWTLQAVA